MTAHAHGHSHLGDLTQQTSNRLALSLGLTLAFVAFEAIAGLRANSLALLSDAGHNLTDVAALGLRLCQYISCPFRWRFSPINFLQISGAARIALFSGLFRRTGAGLLNAQPTSFRCATNLNDETDKLFFDKA